MPNITLGITKAGNRKSVAYKLHDRTYRALNINAMVAIDCDQTRGTPEGGKLNISGVVAHYGSQIFCAVSNHPVQFAGENGRVP